MKTSELYLKTAFVCSACDGEIAPEEVSYVKELSNDRNLFSEDLDIEGLLNLYIVQINEEGMAFINRFIKDLSLLELTEDEQLKIVEIAIKMIEADGKIMYDEVKFFKKLRMVLPISDEKITEQMSTVATIVPIEDFLLPDIREEEYSFDFDTTFASIDLSFINNKTNQES